MKENPFVISTGWNAHAHQTVEGMLFEIQQVGFHAIELGYSFNEKQLKDIISIAPRMGIKIASVHNFCPLPAENKFNRYDTDYYRLSSLDKSERRLAIDYTKRSIDTASAVSCPVVIVHAGTIEMPGYNPRALISLYNENKYNSEKYQEIKKELLSARWAESKAYLDCVVRSLDEILTYASKNDIQIAIENRYYLNEIPNGEEIGYLLQHFRGRNLVYWHDVGHAETNQRLGIIQHMYLLEQFSHDMLGLHIHDIKGLDDHLVPFKGDFDFSCLVPYLKENVIKVLEVHPPVSSEEIKIAIQMLTDLIC